MPFEAGDRGRLVRETLVRNPTNQDDGEDTCYIDTESLEQMRNANQISEEVKAVKSKSRKWIQQLTTLTIILTSLRKYDCCSEKEVKFFPALRRSGLCVAICL
jgi:hypothetical protein